MAGLVAMTSVVGLVVVDLRMEVVLGFSLGCWVVEVTFSPQANSRDEAKSIISNFGIVRAFIATNFQFSQCVCNPNGYPTTPEPQCRSFVFMSLSGILSQLKLR